MIVAGTNKNRRAVRTDAIIFPISIPLTVIPVRATFVANPWIPAKLATTVATEAKRNIWTTEEETKYKEWALSEEGKQYGVAAKQARKAANIATFGTILQTAASSAYMGFKTAPAKPPAKVTP